MSKYAGIVLAGGMSSRFGEPKALASWQGSTFIEHILKVMTTALQEVVVISNSDIKERVEQLVQVPVIEDIPHYKGNGPLAGIVSGMEYIEADWYAIMPCDAPNVSHEWFTILLEQTSYEYDAVVPIINGRKQPLLAAYHNRVKEKIYALLQEEKRSMGQLLSQCNVKYIAGEDVQANADWFINVNTKEEYVQAQKNLSNE
ncbi:MULTISPECIES: molybdenum cofactor guanylyltransferase [Bacillus]|uniref:Probable molybdenum cofactor guanylyltransferase n=1 Tax=Bacillus wiedmannii TaxID=1890302 RepID=A0A2B6HHF3_9BACI|nr:MULTISPECIES: molybdenum cofactor guanylyltransferase [Bacillus]MDF9664331.1 molybdenum cofactor guanylyltransferase [Bacillus wiedmannii]MDI6507471.1 molybdenum cofactor guanylyltransferase [Bacillus wiedmannii]MDI6511525.1 molybdenum cofactor guanylyltransferase [Bacillus wiedmannii]MDR4940038.1 molybdenum cofactor guanylyltransferase [Bacillus wiedmannii]PEA43098.1 molybdenum cofactor guanylyltransferase [Bacillus wiedmannii]